jgi:DNA-binding GntR family transcriptional regulator
MQKSLLGVKAPAASPPFRDMPIPRSHTRSNAAYESLKARILEGSIPAATALREVDVAAQLSLGRTPVREALKRLEDEGLLTLEPRRGLVVRSFDQQAVIELYAMREVLEAAAARFAAKHATAADNACITTIVDEARAGAEPVASNQAFHHSIHAAARNRFLAGALNSLTDSTFLLGNSTLADAERARLAVAEHATIAAAIIAGDAEGAEAAMRIHIGNALQERLKMLRRKD